MKTDSLAPTFRPPWAYTVWAGDNDIFMEIPCKKGPPYISRFPKTEAGLGKALAIMKDAYEAHKPAPPYAPPKQDYRRRAVNFTESQRDNALEALKKAGII